jgi:hypothetical protein
MSYSSLQRDCGCPKCGRESAGEKQRLSYDTVKEEFQKRGYTLVSKAYKRNSIPLEYICNKHKAEGIQTITYSDLQQHKGCYYCGVEARTGENCYCWKGGISPLGDYLRTHIQQWKVDSMKACEFKCVITGGKFDVVHHLYGFNMILQEVLDETGIPIYDKIGSYTEEQLEMLTNRVIAKHYEYPLGVCLTEEIHALFHSIYGKGDNTPEQFHEFIKCYNKRENIAFSL